MIDADLCIVGAGAAGITLATELAGTAQTVIVLVGGGPRERASDRDLYRGSSAAGTSHEPLDENRRRCWGGSTSVWGGRCIPLDPIDFEARDYVPHSGWPITYADMLEFFERANRICEAGAFSFDAPSTLPSGREAMIAGFDGPDMTSSRLERWSPPTHFGRRYMRQLRAASNVRVYMHAHATKLRTSPDGTSVHQVECASAPGDTFAVRAHRFVLACGGLENARLLLASTDRDANGVGNTHGNVGRYYMSHLIGSIAAAELRLPLDDSMYGFERDAEGVYCRRRLWPTPQAQRRLRIGNGILEVTRPDVVDQGHRTALFSATHLAKTYRAAFSRRSPAEALRVLRDSAPAQREHWQVVVSDFRSAGPDLARLVHQRWFARRRLPIVLGHPPGRTVDLRYQTEQAPNPSSRLVLGDARDALGVPRLVTDVALSELDFETVVKLHALLAQRLEESAAGTLVYKTKEIRARLAEHTTHFNSSAHHLGTTRMAARAEDGVVDADCRVYGVDNLYVTGGSVFPTGGHANPTLTIVALAVRLSRHLNDAGGSSARNPSRLASAAPQGPN